MLRRRALAAVASLALLQPACAQLPAGAGAAASDFSSPASQSPVVPATPSPAAPDSTSAAAFRWRSELAAFAQAERLQPPTPGGVVFVGSSSIRLWSTLARDVAMPPNLVVNRGFGGATLPEATALVEPLVLRHRPAQVLLYAGDNDLAEGRTPQQIAGDYLRFVASVRAALPATRIDFIAIKPSPAREALLARAREANALVEAHAALLPDAGFIDVFTPMLGADGRPRAELFAPDRLHLNEAGYRLWQALIAPRLIPLR